MDILILEGFLPVNFFWKLKAFSFSVSSDFFHIAPIEKLNSHMQQEENRHCELKLSIDKWFFL